MTQQMIPAPAVGERIFEVLAAGNIGILKPEERVEFYRATCESLGVNPLTRPFEYLVLNGKTVLYATRACADQLRKIHGISISEPRIEYQDDLVIVTVTGRDATGRTDSEIGAVPLGNLKGEARSNAIMKALTKSKRRLTLSMAGLGMLDETEVDSIPAARRQSVQMPQARVAAPVDQETGEYKEPPSTDWDERKDERKPAPRPQPAAKEPPFGSEDWTEPPADEPRWTNGELGDVVKAHGLVISDLGCVLGQPVTKANFAALINAAMDADPDLTIALLVQRAEMVLHAEAEQRELVAN